MFLSPLVCGAFDTFTTKTTGCITRPQQQQQHLQHRLQQLQQQQQQQLSLTLTSTTALFMKQPSKRGGGGGGGSIGGGGKKMLSPREEEIQRKILQLKRQGKISKTNTNINNNNDDDNPNEEASSSSSASTTTTSSKSKTDYTQKLQDKLGTKKGRMMGFDMTTTTSNEDLEDDDFLDDDDDDNDDSIMNESSSSVSPARLGSLSSFNDGSVTQDEEEELLTPLSRSSSSSSSSLSSSSTTTTTKKKKYIINPDLFQDESGNKDELSEEDLVELVERKLQEKLRRSSSSSSTRQQQTLGVVSSSSSSPSFTSSSSTTTTSTATVSSPNTTTFTQITSGVGGNWNTNESVSAKDDMYIPSSSGSWGAFPRPRDISKAYGGGRQVKPGSTTTTTTEDETRERLRLYRERVGIEVQSEKDHAVEINEALTISSYAMQRGVYATAVSALEKVTKYCSTNSKVGGKVFLELAMAYEAVGRAGEAMTVYRTLTTCRMEDIKFNAKRLLYGMEAMQFMRDEAKSADFSRKKISNTFIDTTGLANIAQQFDNVYQTAYIDLNSNFYRRLTEAVVRSNREARQILLKATDNDNHGEKVDRLKIVQALRSMSRNFETALEKEIRTSQPKPEPVAIMNGKPIVPDGYDDDDDDDDSDDLNNVMNSMDEFVLASAGQMMENLQGEWRLQLIADRRGDGVKYFNNSSISWQRVDTDSMTFQSSGHVGFLTMAQSGAIEFDETRRVLIRQQVQSSSGGIGSGIGGIGIGGWTSLLLGVVAANPKDGGVMGAICSPQQIMSVDSILLITQCAASAVKRKDNADKDHYAVWRRVEGGTYFKRR